jgi:hypothetical protein
VTVVSAEVFGQQMRAQRVVCGFVEDEFAAKAWAIDARVLRVLEREAIIACNVLVQSCSVDKGIVEVISKRNSNDLS